MIINLKDIKFYFLTTGHHKFRSNHIKNMMKDYEIKEINPIMGIGKQRSGCFGHAKMIVQGLKDQIGQDFTPFIILEDDVSIYSEHDKIYSEYNKLPDQICIPDDSDIVYVGLSASGAKPNDYLWDRRRQIYGIDIENKECIRIYNMLATHAIMICNRQIAKVYQKCMEVNYYNNGPAWDTYLAKIQPHYNVYALKKPLFFQDKKYGGNEYGTNINFLDHKLYESPKVNMKEQKLSIEIYKKTKC